MPGLLIPRKVAASWGGGAVAALTLASLNAGFVTLSFAADMSAPAPVYTKAPVAPQASWTGFYLGGSVGFRSLRSDGTTTSLVEDGAPIDLTLAAVSEPLDGTAVRLSPYLGYNWQVAPQWVLGVEGDLGFANQTTRLNGFVFSTSSFSDFGSNADSFALKATWDASLRGRVGYLLTPSSLVYLSGGAAWQHYSVISTCIGNVTNTSFARRLRLRPRSLQAQSQELAGLLGLAWRRRWGAIGWRAPNIAMPISAPLHSRSPGQATE